MSSNKRLLRVNGINRTEEDRFEEAQRLRAGVRPPSQHRSYIDTLLDEARADDERERERQHADAVERQYQHIMRNGGKQWRAAQHALIDQHGQPAVHSRPLSTKPNIAYFAYGRNMNPADMRRRCPDAKPVGAYVLDDYKLVFRNVADVVKHKGHKVHGVVWMISEACEAALDRAEGYPRVYAKGTFKAEVKGKMRDVMFYRMNGRTLVAPPSEMYLRTIMAGYAAFRIENGPLIRAAQSAYDAAPPMRPFKAGPQDEQWDENPERDFF